MSSYLLHHKTIKLDNIHKTTEEIQCSYATCGKKQTFQSKPDEVMDIKELCNWNNII